MILINIKYNFPILLIASLFFGCSTKNISSFSKNQICDESKYSQTDDKIITNTNRVLAQICCVEHSGKNLTNKALNTCNLIKLKKKDWMNPVYVKDLTQNLSFFENETLGLQTGLNAAIFANRAKSSKEQVFQLLFAPLEPLNANNLKSENNNNLASSSVTEGIIIAAIINKSTNVKLLRQSRKYLKHLVNEFYSQPKEQEKIQFFNMISNALEAIIFKQPELLNRTWNQIKNQSEVQCKSLSKSEVTAINELMSSVTTHLFDFKNDLPAGDFYEMANIWNSICGIR